MTRWAHRAAAHWPEIASGAVGVLLVLLVIRMAQAGPERGDATPGLRPTVLQSEAIAGRRP